MANYDIPQYPTKRLRYFNNQFLNEQDFIDDGASQLGHERAILRSLCVAGVCEGLVVSYPAPNTPPSVSAGVAIDKNGCMIVIDQPTAGLANPAGLADGDYFVSISFLEAEDAKATGQGAPDYTRWKQTPVINATAKTAALPDGAVVLGSCTVKTGQFVGSGTTIGRQYSGLRLPGANPGATATLRNTGAADDLAVLGGALTIRRDIAGQLGPTLTLLNGSAGGAGTGGAIDFNGYDPGINDPTARIRSLDDGNSSSHLAFFTKTTGDPANKLVERVRLTNNGLLQFPTDSGDKVVISDNGTDRYGIGLNSSNINLFCPTTAHFSLRQNSSSGNEVFSVSGSGTATIRRDVSGALGPTLTLFNGSAPSTAGGAGGSIDFNGSDPGANDPSLRIQSIDDGQSSSHLTFLTKPSGATTNKLAERLRLTSDGVLKFPNEIKDKITFSDAGANNRYGLGLGGSNINLFYPTGASFSLRQNNCNGTEMFNVDSSGNATFHGRITPKVGNDGGSGIYFPTNPGGGGGDEAFLRYHVISGETCRLVLGINNDGDDYLSLYQMGGERINLSWGQIYMNATTLFSGYYGPNSDLTLKHDVRDLESILAGVMQLRPVRFAWNQDNTQDLGFIAQEVEAQFPELVFDVPPAGAPASQAATPDQAATPPSPIKALSTHHLGVIAIAAVRELKQELDTRVGALEQKLAAQGATS